MHGLKSSPGIFAALVLAPSPAAAAPVYLECEAVGYADHLRHLRINLNESEGTAHVTIIETGYSQERPAMFSPSEVTWVNLVAGFRQHFTIDRRTLAFSTHMDGINDSDEHGQCTMPKDDPSRRF